MPASTVFWIVVPTLVLLIASITYAVRTRERR